MAYRNLLVEDRGAVRRITINRPDKLNALSSVVISELTQAAAAIEVSDEIRVVAVTGAGAKAFVAGADIHHVGRIGRDLDKLCATHLGEL